MGTLTGSVKMWCLRHNSTIIRDQFVILPMPDLVAAHITAIANQQGYQRGLNPDVGPLQFDDRDEQHNAAFQLPNMMAIDGRADGVHLADNHHLVAEAGVTDGHLKEIDETTVAKEAAASAAEDFIPDHGQAEVFNPDDGQLESEKVVEAHIRVNVTGANDITDAHSTADNSADAQANDPESRSHNTDNILLRVGRRNRGGVDSLQNLGGFWS